ncbi:MAG: chorismate-binding protein [Brachybacterium sp.]|nr:chorismate-binding protein [Brachybacterium sp.]
MKILLVDNHDSYTYNLHQLIARTLGTVPHVIAADDPALDARLIEDADAVVISPGPGRPQCAGDVGAWPALIAASDVPVLGVCLGHQGLALLSGADVALAPAARHGHISRLTHTGGGLFAHLPQGTEVVRYHSLAVPEPLPETLIADAWSEDGVLQGFHHRDRPWWGVQFHPESVASAHGETIIRTFAELAGLRGSAPRLLRRRIPAAPDPEALAADLLTGAHVGFWLDSALVDHRVSTSAIGVPGGRLGEVLRYRVGTGHVEVLDERAAPVATLEGTILDVLEQRLQTRHLPADPTLPLDLDGGYVGALGYEVKTDLGHPASHRSRTPDAVWIAATRTVAIDHRAGEAWALALVDPADPDDVRDGERWLDRAEAAVRDAARPVTPNHVPPAPRDAPPARPGPSDAQLEEHLHVGRAAYLTAVEDALAELRAGESYEICLTNELTAPAPADPFGAYRAQRRTNPAPRAAYLRVGDLHVLSSSPEQFLTIDRDRIIESAPIKGTAPRDHEDAAADAAIAAALTSSPKTRAENLMIVDLVRNDLGRICEIGSVEVPELMAVETYASVHQLVTRIRGHLRPGVTAIDALRAAFPGGSMTGAPKRRTMEIIDRLEDRARGLYSGTLGYLGLAGTADLSIIIRTAVIQDGLLTVGAGGAIVLDSDPEEEWQEMLLKLRAPLLGTGLDEQSRWLH